MSRRIGMSIAVAILALCLVSALVGLYQYRTQLVLPLGIESTSLFEIEQGDSANRVLTRVLQRQSAEMPRWVGKIWLKLNFSQETVKRGVYELTPEQTLQDVFDLFAQGKQKQFSITLVEGLTWKAWQQLLAKAPHLNNDWRYKNETGLLKQLSQSMNRNLTSLEGLLLADTYYYTAGTPISELVQRAAMAMSDALNARFHNQPLPDGLSHTYDVLTLASIVEKETAKQEERPLIAGVFVNRLNNNMRLQTDPTIIYGLGEEYKGDITREHLRRPTPYNTYVIKGLPPTPIAMVGTAALDAVRDAESTAYLYFVAKGDGSHHFSESLEEHNRAVRQYQLQGN